MLCKSGLGLQRVKLQDFECMYILYVVHFLISTHINFIL